MQIERLALKRRVYLKKKSQLKKMSFTQNVNKLRNHHLQRRYFQTSKCN